MGQIPQVERPRLMYVYLNNGLPHLIFGYPTKVFEILVYELGKGLDKALISIRVL